MMLEWMCVFRGLRWCANLILYPLSEKDLRGKDLGTQMVAFTYKNERWGRCHMVAAQ